MLCYALAEHARTFKLQGSTTNYDLRDYVRSVVALRAQPRTTSAASQVSHYVNVLSRSRVSQARIAHGIGSTTGPREGIRIVGHVCSPAAFDPFTRVST